MLKKITIDCYGNRNDLDPERFNRIAGKRLPHLVDESDDNVTYIAYNRATVAQPIRKVIESDGVTTVWWGFGLWANRATLNYDLVPSETCTVDVEED